jgi:hypothetical protein
MSDYYKLSEVIANYRTDRPDEWSMDIFIRGAEKLEAERDALKKMLDIAWDAVQEAGYEDFAHQLRDFMEGEG